MNNTPPTQEEIDHMRSIAGQITSAIFAAAGPHLMEIVAVLKPNTRYVRQGDNCVIEPFDPFADMVPGTVQTLDPADYPIMGGRDYRKQLWLQTFENTMAINGTLVLAEEKANDALARFDAAFPK